MAIKFQYNKTSLQSLDKQLKMRVRALPTIKNKESALRSEVKKAKEVADEFDGKLDDTLNGISDMLQLYDEYTPDILTVKDVNMSVKKIAGVRTPVLDQVEYEIKDFSLFNAPGWFLDGIQHVKEVVNIALEREFYMRKMELLDRARKKTTQKVNLYEKVQIPGFQEAIRKIKRFLEDEENLSKSAQKIVKTRKAMEDECMIVPMRKLSLLIFYRDYQAFLGELREKGVVHIHENKKRSAEDEELKHKFAVIKRIGEMIKQLSKRIPETKETFTELLERWSQAMEPKEKLFFYQQVFYAGDRLKEESEVTELDLLTFLENQFKRMEHIDQQIASLEKEGMIYEPWGDLPDEQIGGLQRAGWDRGFSPFPTGNIYLNGKTNTMRLL